MTSTYAVYRTCTKKSNLTYWFCVLAGMDSICHPYEPFKCPGDGACISIQYLCDGAPDCPDGYDEDPRLCTAGKAEKKKIE